MSLSEINSKVAEAIALHEAGDLAGAVKRLEQAKMLLAAIPNTRHGSSGVDLEYDRAAIDSLLTDLRRQQAAALGVRKTKITYARPTG